MRLPNCALQPVTTTNTTTRQQPTTMASRKEVPIEVRKKILRLRLEGKTYVAIERATGVRRQTCSKIVNRAKKSGTLQNAPRSGRPLKLSLRDLRVLERVFIKNPYMSATDITRSNGLNIFVCSVQYYWN